MRIPGHRRFSDEEQIQAFDDLFKWVKEGKRPEGDDVMADLRDAGRKFTNPLRPYEFQMKALRPKPVPHTGGRLCAVFLSYRRVRRATAAPDDSSYCGWTEPRTG